MTTIGNAFFQSNLSTGKLLLVVQIRSKNIQLEELNPRPPTHSLFCYEVTNIVYTFTIPKTENDINTVSSLVEFYK
jgi:hypothetical protein